MKLRNYYQTVLAVSLLVTALSCHDAKKVETQSPLTDSVAVESNIEDHYLPDTMYASANKFKSRKTKCDAVIKRNANFLCKTKCDNIECTHRRKSQTLDFPV